MTDAKTAPDVQAQADAKPAAAGRIMIEPRTIEFKKSDVTVRYDAAFNAADTLAAQRAAGKDSSRFVLYLLQRIATFNGSPWTAQQIEEKLRGMDFLKLQGAVLSDGDEEPAGND